MKEFIASTLCSFKFNNYIPNNSVTTNIRKNQGYFSNQSWDIKSLFFALLCLFAKQFSTGKIGQGVKNGI